MVQWLDAALEVTSLLRQCINDIAERDPSMGDALEETSGKTLRRLGTQAKRLRKHPFFQQGEAIEAELRSLEEAEAKAERKAEIERQLAAVRREMLVVWSWQSREAMAGVGELGSDALEGDVLEDVGVAYRQTEHTLLVTVDAVPEIAEALYGQFQEMEGRERAFVVGKATGVVAFEVGLTIATSGTSTAGKLAKAEKLGELGDVSKTTKLLGKHGDAVDMGHRKHIDADVLREVEGSIPRNTGVWVDERLGRGDVVVDYDVHDGVIDTSSVRIVTGPDASPGWIILHGATVTAVHKYAGLQGRIRKLLAELRRLLMGVDEGAGSARWEAKHEVEKLPGLVDAELARLRAATPGSKEAEEIQETLEGLAEQFEYWSRVVDGELTPGEARGLIAAKKKKKKPRPLNELQNLSENGAPRTRAEQLPLFDSLDDVAAPTVRNHVAGQRGIELPYSKGSRILTFDTNGNPFVDGVYAGPNKMKEIYQVMGLTHVYRGHGPHRTVAEVINDAASDYPHHRGGRFSSDRHLVESAVRARAEFLQGNTMAAEQGRLLVEIDVAPVVGRAFMLTRDVGRGVPVLLPLEIPVAHPEFSEILVTRVIAIFNSNGTFRTMYPTGP